MVAKRLFFLIVAVPLLLLVPPLSWAASEPAVSGKVTGTLIAEHPDWFKESFLDLSADLDEANAALRGRVVTELQERVNYSRAEDYHQHYFARNPGQGYCAFVVAPKVDKFRRSFKARVRA